MKFEIFEAMTHASTIADNIEETRETVDYVLPMVAKDWKTATKNAIRAVRALGLLDDIMFEGLESEWSSYKHKGLMCRHYRTGRNSFGGIWILKVSD